MKVNTWVCFDCRTSCRSNSGNFRRCPSCSKDMAGLTIKARIPKKNAPSKEWEFIKRFIWNWPSHMKKPVERDFREGMFSVAPSKPNTYRNRLKNLWVLWERD